MIFLNPRISPWQRQRMEKAAAVSRNIKRLEASLVGWERLAPTQKATLRRKLLRIVKRVFPRGDGLLK